MHKPLIFDQNTLQPDDFVEGELIFPGWPHSLAPTSQPVSRGPFPFDFKTCAAVRQEKETRGARHHMCACTTQNFSRFLCQSAFREFVEPLRPAYDRAI